MIHTSRFSAPLSTADAALMYDTAAGLLREEIAILQLSEESRIQEILEVMQLLTQYIEQIRATSEANPINLELLKSQVPHILSLSLFLSLFLSLPLSLFFFSWSIISNRTLLALCRLWNSLSWECG